MEEVEKDVPQKWPSTKWQDEMVPGLKRLGELIVLYYHKWEKEHLFNLVLSKRGSFGGTLRDDIKQCRTMAPQILKEIAEKKEALLPAREDKPA